MRVEVGSSIGRYPQSARRIGGSARWATRCLRVGAMAVGCLQKLVSAQDACCGHRVGVSLESILVQRSSATHPAGLFRASQ